jgi:protein-S-isoprenylcysteine O-methyltransferase Ste14
VLGEPREISLEQQREVNVVKNLLSYSLPVAGLAAFLSFQSYAAGFLLNYGVPKTIDSGREGPVTRALLIDVLLLTLFGLQHSIMARQAFKRWLARLIPEQFGRSVYVILSCAVLAAVMFHWQPLKQPVWSATQGYAVALMLGLFAAGCLILNYSILVIGVGDLFGFRQVGQASRSEPYAPLAFSQPALYRYVRHPMMTGTLLVFWATPSLTVGHLLFAAVMTCYVAIGIACEERDLIRLYGDRYRRYQQQVGMLLPFRKGDR